MPQGSSEGSLLAGFVSSKPLPALPPPVPPKSPQPKPLPPVPIHLDDSDDDSDDDAPLFGPPQNGVGLGLDSLDALQLAMSIEEQLGVRIPEGDEARAIFQSVRSIADHVAKVRSA